MHVKAERMDRLIADRKDCGMEGCEWLEFLAWFWVLAVWSFVR